MKITPKHNKNWKMAKASDILRQKANGNREYTVVTTPANGSSVAKGFVPGSWIHDSEYEQALKLKEHLIQKFEGQSIEHVIPGHVISNEYGDCYRIQAECVNQLHKLDYWKNRRCSSMTPYVVSTIIGGRRLLVLTNERVRFKSIF